MTTPKNIIDRLHYIQKWRKGAKIPMPTPQDISLAIDDAIRYIRGKERYKDEQITREILIKNGYEKVDDCITINNEYTQYRSQDGRIVVSTNLSNTPGREWVLHIDSEDFDTIGAVDVGTINHFNAFLDLCEYKGDRLHP